MQLSAPLCPQSRKGTPPAPTVVKCGLRLATCIVLLLAVLTCVQIAELHTQCSLSRALRVSTRVTLAGLGQADLDPQQQQLSATASPANSTIKLFVGVLSTANHAQARQAVGETWGADKRIARLMFFTQRPADDDDFRRLREEAALLGDVVVSSEIAEDYYNITYSTLQLFRTAAHLGGGITHVVKTDEDCYVRLSQLLPALEAMPRQWLYAGWPMSADRVSRKKGWHYVPYSNWASNTPIKYGFGWGYVTSIDLAREIAAGSPHTIMPANNLLILEDVAMGAWVRHIAREKGVAITYDKTIRLSNGSHCSAGSMFYHAKGTNAPHWDVMRCMHARGGQCCPHLAPPAVAAKASAPASPTAPAAAAPVAEAAAAPAAAAAPSRPGQMKYAAKWRPGGGEIVFAHRRP